MTNTIGLRARKHAQTKQALLLALVARLETRTFDEVSVKELCAEVGVSEPTFFNYFPRKADLLFYFIQLWSIEAAWHAGRVTTGPMDAITAIFDFTAEQMARSPGVAREVLAFQARRPTDVAVGEVTLAERRLAFPGLEGVDKAPGRGLEGLLPPLVAAAVKAKELPKSVDPETVVVALVSVFFGVPLVMQPASAARLRDAYRSQLDLVWAGVRSAAPRPRKARKGGKRS